VDEIAKQAENWRNRNVHTEDIPPPPESDTTELIPPPPLSKSPTPSLSSNVSTETKTELPLSPPPRYQYQQHQPMRPTYQHIPALSRPVILPQQFYPMRPVMIPLQTPFMRPGIPILTMPIQQHGMGIPPRQSNIRPPSVSSVQKKVKSPPKVKSPEIKIKPEQKIEQKRYPIQWRRTNSSLEDRVILPEWLASDKTIKKRKIEVLSNKKDCIKYLMEAILMPTTSECIDRIVLDRIARGGKKKLVSYDSD